MAQTIGQSFTVAEAVQRPWRRPPDAVRRLVAAGADVNVGTNTGYTSLMSAARQGHLANVAMLLQAGADVNAVTGGSPSTALHWAVENGHAEVVRQLVEAGADLDVETGTGERPVELAAAMGHAEVEHYLLAAEE